MINQADRLKQNYHRVLERVADAAKKVGRDPSDIKLVVVTKGHPVDTIQNLLDLGVKNIGENRVEEARQKMLSLPAKNDVQWHMIGHVQSRKANSVCQHFNYLHSLDRLKLARRLEKSAAEMGIKLPVLLQFNVSGEAAKSGWEAHDSTAWPSLLAEISEVILMPHLSVEGLMTMAPYGLDSEITRPIFSRLRRLRDFLAAEFPQVELNELSMGMSADFEVGVEEGATLIRVGSAILAN